MNIYWMYAQRNYKNTDKFGQTNLYVGCKYNLMSIFYNYPNDW